MESYVVTAPAAGFPKAFSHDVGHWDDYKKASSSSMSHSTDSSNLAFRRTVPFSPSQVTMGNLKIAIIGAGPAGCMLARLLHLGGIDAVVFEGETSPNYRSQGGTLDLHTSTGLASMKEAGIFDEFLKYARYDGQYMAIVDKNLKYHLERGAETKSKALGGERPEIDRARLRQILVESLPEGTVKWGHHLQKVEAGTLIFDHTTASGFDLIVGAEGAWSKVRKAIAPEVQPLYAGVGMHQLGIPDAKNTAPEVYDLVNRGSIFASSEGKRVSIQQMGDGSINIYVGCVREDADWMSRDKCGYDAEDLVETKKALREEFADWCPLLRDAIERTQDRCIPRSLFRLPIGATWEHKKGLTLIGDAAHLMTPYAGEGVNQALEDAMILARSILQTFKEGKDLDKAVQRFEVDMMVRVKEIQQLADDLCEMWMYTPGAPKMVVPRAMSRHLGSHLPWIARPLATAVVHSIFYFKNLRA